MKKVWFMLCGCIFLVGIIYGYKINMSFVSQEQQKKVKTSIDQASNGVQRNDMGDLTDLSDLWYDFYNGIQQNKDPTDDFKQSDFLYELKNYFNNRKSLLITANELEKALPKNQFKIIEKTIQMSDLTEYHVRIINFYADTYVKVLTDKLLYNKWTFIQCWNDDEFYFSTLTDGDLFYSDDFTPYEENGTLVVAVEGIMMGGAPDSVLYWKLKDGVFIKLIP